MAWGKTDQQKIEEQAAREEQARTQQQEQAQAAYAASPVGRAEAAYRAGDVLFQLELQVSQLWNGKIQSGGPLGVILGQVESVGWHLEHTGYVFVQAASAANSTSMAYGSAGFIGHHGEVMGVYLFRRIPGT